MRRQKTYLGVPAYDPELSADIDPRTVRSGVSALESRLLRTLLRLMGQPRIRVVLWDGEEHYSEGNPPLGTVRFGDRGTLWRLATNSSLHFGDDYAAGRIEIGEDLPAVLTELFRARVSNTSPGRIQRFVTRGVNRRRGNRPTDSRDNIHHHYDLGNEFYRLWLDREMSYTCAYFPTADATLEAAQLAKMDHVCRKVELRPGDTVVEAGCGWGSLALHMARNYGARVKAYNISREQVAYARERAAREGLDDRVEFIEDDYRNIEGRFDAFVSVGMLEHVGVDNYAGLGTLIDRVLHQNGRGLIHSIGQNRPEPTGAWTERRIFPGGYAPTLRQMMQIFEGPGFTVTDVENLRLHYARTLEHWLQRYESHIDAVRERFDEFFVRAWRLYLAASIGSFRSGSLQLFQVVFTRPTKNDLPWTRAYLYQPPRTS